MACPIYLEALTIPDPIPDLLIGKYFTDDVKMCIRDSYIYGKKELKCVKESARLFQQLHPDTILYEAKGYNHGYLSAYLPQEWIKLVVPFLENND